MRPHPFALVVLVHACKPASEPPMTSPSADPTPTAPTTPTAPPARDPEVPADSGDYTAPLVEARRYRQGEIDFAELQRRILAMQLPPHRLGDAYLMSPVPMPPPGVSFDPKRMPGDWERTWGEVAMTVFAGKLTQEEYDRLHAAAHPGCRR